MPNRKKKLCTLLRVHYKEHHRSANASFYVAFPTGDANGVEEMLRLSARSSLAQKNKGYRFSVYTLEELSGCHGKNL